MTAHHGALAGLLTFALAGCEADRAAPDLFGGAFEQAAQIGDGRPVCVTTTGSDLVAVDMQTGAMTTVLTLTPPGGFGVKDLVPFDGYWYACDQEVLRWDLTTGAGVATGRPCWSLTTNSSHLAVQASSLADFQLYTSSADFDASVSSGSFPDQGTYSRSASRGQYYVGAWHSTNYVGVHDILTGAYWGISLEYYDSWVWGVSLLAGDLLLIDDGRQDGISSETRIHRFDPSGDWLDEVNLGSPLYGGLHCTVL